MKINRIQFHESGHIIVSRYVGRKTPVLASVVGNRRFGGWVMTSGNADGTPLRPMQELITLAAGDAAELLFSVYEVQCEPPLSARIEPEDPVLHPNSLAACANDLMDSGESEPLTDWAQIENLIAGCVAAGVIRHRERLVHRWWGRARYLALQILRSKELELRAMAEALAECGSVTANEIDRILGATNLQDKQAPAAAPLLRGRSNSPAWGDRDPQASLNSGVST